MRLGLSSFSFPWAVGVPGHRPTAPLTAADLVDRTAELGLGLLQIGDNLPLHRLTRDELTALRSAAASHSVNLQVGTRGIGPHLMRYAELAEELGADFVRVVIDAGDDRPTPQQARERLQSYEADFRRRGLRLAIENHDRFTAAELVGLVTELGEWTAICLDTVNSLGALEPPAVVVSRLGPWAINLHLKDFTIRRHSHQMGFEIEGTPAGSGRLDIGWLLAELKPYDQLRTAVLELWTPPEATLEETVTKEAAWVETSLGYLRNCPELTWP